MLSAAFAVHPAAVAPRLHSVRQRQQFCAPIGTATPRRRLPVAMLSVTNAVTTQSRESAPAAPRKLSFPILVNSCTGKMGKSVAEAAVSAGLQLVPVSFSAIEVPDGKLNICDRDIHIHDPSESERILRSIAKDYPDMIVVDYTVPDAVNANAELYCKLGLPFVMGTTGGNRQLLNKTVQDANVYAVISPQMGKQVVAFLAAMEIMAEKFPGAFAGYKLEVMESHQATKLDVSGTAKAVISCFQKLGVSFDLNEVNLVRDPEEQLAIVGVPEEHLGGHAFHNYHLTSPDETVSFEFQHNVCGRSIYAEGTVDAAMFLHTKIRSGADKKLYDMIDVLREGNMR
ncbi:hypothetical protein CFC21_010620 [Triticum aestivum]|uniref:4-hydroxy-tetrahydrodipicolinate reductase n=2 Tax=Triticum aestivum TaxID=4565 RepID=A0A3B5ZQJ3_WHEAT|nr:probable 4-hydroxy-tetrahydrodipicolinate reductase 1, chloroplastic [Triticum aestivum]KAF6993780.1 hypothetical protein CFC21_010620 [Triticum aestivum]